VPADQHLRDPFVFSTDDDHPVRSTVVENLGVRYLLHALRMACSEPKSVISKVRTTIGTAKVVTNASCLTSSILAADGGGGNELVVPIGRYFRGASVISQMEQFPANREIGAPGRPMRIVSQRTPLRLQAIPRKKTQKKDGA